MLWLRLFFAYLREAAMLRICVVLLSVVFASTSAGGCRSCSHCHDYGPPVANCDCHACGTHRAGSASDEVLQPELVDEGYHEPQPVEAELQGEALPPQSSDGPAMEPESLP
jgi:hypothetical protein